MDDAALPAEAKPAALSQAELDALTDQLVVKLKTVVRSGDPGSTSTNSA